jgi:hopanoid biosynthesis associated protein HpnK
MLSRRRRESPELIDWAVRQVIINADDFGLTRGVNRAVMELHRKGALTSATLMARAAATEEAIEQALNTPSLGVGCHVVLVDGEPVLSPRQDIPNLVDPISQRFRSSMVSFLFWLCGQTSRLTSFAQRTAEIEAEAAAQIALLKSCGLRLTHIDTHKHTHMFPAVLRPLLRAARAAGISAVRNPFEPAWSRRATSAAPLLRCMEVALLRQLEPAFRRIVYEEGFTTTDGALAVLATGTLDAKTVRSLFESIPPGTWELVTHPGYNDTELARLQTRLKESRETELQALMAMGKPDGLELISFAQLGAGETEIAIHSAMK